MEKPESRFAGGAEAMLKEDGGKMDYCQPRSKEKPAIDIGSNSWDVLWRFEMILTNNSLLIFIMGIPVLVIWHLYIERAPRCSFLSKWWVPFSVIDTCIKHWASLVNTM